MNTQLKVLAALTLATMVTPPLALAQDPNLALAAYVPPGETAEVADSAGVATTQAPRTNYSQQELDQMLAPVALYPDPLLSQLMMAATYPLEVVQAARWSRANPKLQGDEAVRAVQQQDWDPSVKSLVAFPQVLAQLDEHIDWTERLGNAFLGQQAQVMQTVQNLRARAEKAGTLASNDRVTVQQQISGIAVEPANPQQVSVPYYDPLSAYGPWMESAYPPMYFAPPPGYAASYGPSNYPAPVVYWGPAIFVSAGFFFGGFDWFHHHCVIVSTRPFYYHPGFGGHPVTAGIGVWHHDAWHRQGVAYAGGVRPQQFTRPGGTTFAAAGWRGQNAAAPAQFRAANAEPGQAARSAMNAAAPARAMETPRAETMARPAARQAAAYNNAPMRFAEARSFDAPRFSAQPAMHYAAPAARSFSGYSAPRVTMASAQYSAPHYSGGGGGGGGRGGGGGGGHGGGGGGHGGRR